MCIKQVVAILRSEMSFIREIKVLGSNQKLWLIYIMIGSRRSMIKVRISREWILIKESLSLLLMWQGKKKMDAWRKLNWKGWLREGMKSRREKNTTSLMGRLRQLRSGFRVFNLNCQEKWRQMQKLKISWNKKYLFD